MTIRASALLGAPVVNRQDCRLGVLSDLLLDDPGPARICYALIEVEEPLQRGERTVAVPWSVLRPDGLNDRLILDVSRDALQRLRNVREP